MLDYGMSALASKSGSQTNRVELPKRPSTDNCSRLASGSGTQLLECGAFQTVEVAFARRRLLKNMLRHFKWRDGLSDQEAAIRYDLVQRLAHDGDRRCIVFLFRINHHRSPSGWARLRVLLQRYDELRPP